MRTASQERLSVSPGGKRKGPASGPSRSSRTNPVRVSGAPRMRTTSEPASHRCVLGIGRWRCGSSVVTLTRPASLHYSVVVQVLGGWTTHGIHGDRAPRLGLSRLRGQA
jgi:hypothetical protein